MALLAVSPPLKKHCGNRSDDLRCGSFLQGRMSLKKKSGRLVVWSSSFPSFPREQPSTIIALPSSLTNTPGVGVREVYQPFRPPPPPVLSALDISIDEQLQILRERRGLWFDYAIHVSSLFRAGFTPPMIEEATGISGVEQNKIVVASQVRSSLQSSGMEPQSLSFYDIGGADLLYELRTLASDQRKAASLYTLARKMDVKEYRELARAMKDHERRRREEGWESFSSRPGDCLAYSCYRLSKEVKSDEWRERMLLKALEYVETENARTKLTSFLDKGEESLWDESPQNQLEVIRLSYGEAGSSSIPYILPVVEPTVQGFEAAPSVSRKGPFTIQHADSAWGTWVSLPAWQPLLNAVMPVAISFASSSLLPWKQKNRRDIAEPIVVVAERQVKSIIKNSYYVVDFGDGTLALQLGTAVSETGSRALGKVVLALRPPLPEENDLDSVEWD